MRIAISTIALVACTSLAAAADLNGPSYGGSLKDEWSAPAAFSWTGFYLGGHGGYAWADVDFPYDPPHGPGLSSGPPRTQLKGGLVGGQVGFNYQLGNVVLGIEGDYSFTKMSDGLRDGNYIVQEHEVNALASIRGRLGIALDRFLPYATVGWGWAEAGTSQSCPHKNEVKNENSHCYEYGQYENKDTQWIDGWVYGGGLEYAVSDRMTVRAEYLHFDFDTASYELGEVPSGKVIKTKKIKHDADVFRIGANFKIGN